jgi:tRNA threonylcarbamoyl adenosine modification protein YeaZ
MIAAMRILVLETSTPRGSLALFEDGDLVTNESFQAHRGHNSTIYAPLQAMLGNNPHQSGVTTILVGTGPGSYTGVRISIAIADAMALSLGAELIGLSSFLGPVGLKASDKQYAVAGDARREQWYCAAVQDAHLKTPVKPVDRECFEDRVQNVKERGRKVLTFDQTAPMDGVEITYPCATALGEWWFREKDRYQAVLPVEPMYLAAPFITKSKKRASNKR